MTSSLQALRDRYYARLADRRSIRNSQKPVSLARVYAVERACEAARLSYLDAKRQANG